MTVADFLVSGWGLGDVLASNSKAACLTGWLVFGLLYGAARIFT